MFFFSVICPAVLSLSFLVGFTFGGTAALVTAVRLASPATSADKKNLATPAALDFPYLCGLSIFDNSFSGIAHNPKK
jgi:hypothetical protein|tara:strand:- start:103 stop:333 length:231 start_codon:yes stop_codon:yes gene_type:complete